MTRAGAILTCRNATSLTPENVLIHPRVVHQCSDRRYAHTPEPRYDARRRCVATVSLHARSAPCSFRSDSASPGRPCWLSQATRCTPSMPPGKRSNSVHRALTRDATHRPPWTGLTGAHSKSHYSGSTRRWPAGRSLMNYHASCPLPRVS